MNMKKALCTLLSVVLLLTVSSCSVPPQPSPTPMATPTTEPTPYAGLRSYTTGLPVAERTAYKPVGVMIENNPACRPQYGLQAADIVYEAPVEGCTRFFCIYNDTLPEKVGPVRSARIYFIKIQQEWDCAYVHFGGPSSGQANVYIASSSHIKTRIDFIKGGLGAYYWRDHSRKAPHNAFTNVQKCQELMSGDADVRTFTYADELQYTGVTVSEVVVPFYTGEEVTYKYDASKDVLLRYSGNKPFTDAETGKAVEVKNLIVQYNRFYHGGEAKDRWLCDLLGSGKAEFFIGGKYVEGTWERKSYDSPTVYRDGNGDEIVLQPGNTWIAVHPKSKDITVKYQ
ncbi:MAG: DUF3048 domain-containing protein [Bacillota bacterium]